jgi:NitT/TauT family transport system permease protein
MSNVLNHLRGDDRYRVWGSRILFVLAGLFVWESVCRLRLWPEYIFPAPSVVGNALWLGIQKQTYLIGIRDSLIRLVQGYLLALAAGLTIGLLMAQVRWLKETFGLLVMGLQTLPSICWLPLALLWFGLNEKAILFVVVMGAVFSIAQSTEDGIRNTPPIYMQAARNLGASHLRLYVSVIFPAALPSILSGMKLGWSFAWRSLMAGELLYTLPGLGHLLMMGRELNDMGQVMAVMGMIVFIGLVLDRLVFGVIEKRVRGRWGLA